MYYRTSYVSCLLSSFASCRGSLPLPSGAPCSSLQHFCKSKKFDYITRKVRSSKRQDFNLLVFCPLLPLVGVRFLFRLALPVHRCSTFARRSAHPVRDEDALVGRKRRNFRPKKPHSIHHQTERGREGGPVCLPFSKKRERRSFQETRMEPDKKQEPQDGRENSYAHKKGVEIIFVLGFLFHISSHISFVYEAVCSGGLWRCIDRSNIDEKIKC